MATAARRLLTAEEFLAIEFPSDSKAELDNGVIRMMAGGTASHARIQRNIQFALHGKLAGSGCSVYGSDMAVRTHGLSIRYPDVSVFCGRDTVDNDALKAFDDPRMIVEILSPSTKAVDENEKMREYRAIGSLDAILYVDPDTDAVRLLSRNEAGGWDDADVGPEDGIELPTLGVSLTVAEVFARG